MNPAWNKYYEAPEDRPCLYDIYEPLNAGMFKQPPVDVLNTKLSDFIGNKFISFRGATEREREETSLTEEVGVEHFEGARFVGLLFSAGFASPCKIMLKYLRNLYSDINLEERQFEVLYVPADRSKSEWEEHFKTHCWPSLPYGDARIKKLQQLYCVTGVPQLVILDTKTGFCITKHARKDLANIETEEQVKAVFANWDKLFQLNKVKGVKRAEQDSIAESQKLLREEIERRRLKIEQMKEDGLLDGDIKAEPA